MKILVAGSTGVIGRLLLPKLIHSGHDVFGMTRIEERKRLIGATGAHAAMVDVLDRDAVMSVLSEIRPEVVIHQLTSLSNRDFVGTSRVRVAGTRNLVDAALTVGVKRIIAQSISWAYEPGEVPATEDVPLDIHAEIPRKRMIESIRALESIVAEIPEHVILRYGMLYGPGTFYDNDGFVAQEVRSKKVPATDGVTSFLHVEDAAYAATLALNWGTGPVNIVDDEPARGTDWIPMYAEALGAPSPDVTQGRDAWERGASNVKARNDYGWKPIYPTWRTRLTKSL